MSAPKGLPRALALAGSALAIPIGWITFDVATRVRTFPPGEPWVLRTYALGAALSLLIWGLGMEAARHPRRRVRFLALALLGFVGAFGIGLQIFVFALTHAYVGRRAVMLALGVPDLAHAGYFAQAGLTIGALCLVPALLTVAIATIRARRFGHVAPRSRGASLGAAVAISVSMFAPFAAQRFQCLPPDVLWLHATGGPLLYLAGFGGKPKSLPAGAHEPVQGTNEAETDAPSIVLLLGESLRRDAVCGSRSADCAMSPRVDGAAPDRVGFSRAFSIASCTELVSTALFTGLPVTAEPERLARAPLLWDFAKARGYRTGYLTSQNLLYQQADLFLRGSRIDRQREARDRFADAPIDGGSPDELTTDEALAFLDGAGPAFLIVHYANTHAPYRQVPGFTPFPTEGPEGARNRYRNGLVHQDAIVGDLLTRLRATERGKRAIVLFTSDHGEAWGEHGAFAHSFDLHAEQIDVPLWIDAPEGSLPTEARDHLRREATTRPVSSLDVSATLIDLLGAMDLPEARAIEGQSLLRAPSPTGPVALWNCPPTRECPAEAFGAIAWPLKLQYVGHAYRYACHDLAVDPGEKSELPADTCAPLRAFCDRHFGERPEGDGR